MYMLIIEIDPELERSLGKRRVQFAEDGQLHELYYEIDTVLARNEFKHGIPTAVGAKLYVAANEPDANYVYLQSYTAPRSREEALTEYYNVEKPIVLKTDPELERLLEEEEEIARRSRAMHAIVPPDQGVFWHKCSDPWCGTRVQYDDEPYCFKHSPDSGSSVKGYSAYQEALKNYVD